jgi:hypothetical protein
MAHPLELVRMELITASNDLNNASCEVDHYRRRMLEEGIRLQEAKKVQAEKLKRYNEVVAKMDKIVGKAEAS